MENEVNKAKQRKTFVLSAIVLSAISIILLGSGFYLFSNSKTVLLQSIGKFTNETKEIIGKSNSNRLQNILKENKIKVSSDILVSMNKEELFNFDFSYLENKKDEKSAFDFNLSQKDAILLESDGILANNNIYVKVKDIMDYYYTECPYISLLEEAPIEDYKKVIDLFYESIKDELNEKDINKSKETIKLGEKDKKVTKLSYKITTKMISNTFTNTTDKILKDKKLVSSLAKVYGINEKEFKESLKTFKEDLKNMENTSLYYNVYYYGFNNIVMYEFKDSKDSIQLYNYNNQYELMISEKDKTLFTLKMVEKNGKYDISGKIDTYNYTGTLTEDDNKITLDINITIQGVIINLKLDQTITEKDNYEVDTKLVLGMVGTEIKLDVNTVYEVGEEVDLTGLENAKDFNTMTQSDIENILTNIQKHPFLSSIYQLIMSYSTMLDDSAELNSLYDYNYENEYEF